MKEKFSVFVVTSSLQLLMDWVNDELAEYRILVKDLEEDLFDGQILQKLIGTRSYCNIKFVCIET